MANFGGRGGKSGSAPTRRADSQRAFGQQSETKARVSIMEDALGGFVALVQNGAGTHKYQAIGRTRVEALRELRGKICKVVRPANGGFTAFKPVALAAIEEAKQVEMNVGTAQ